ncbi:rab-GTPase-TBC domain-containing protein [Polychytrium aggregatum]|uniref:rab-GTPase-TBC domain-containing protein n=1 Tax=Polychytrium aggregatum TaxID=110093 RepID=UPI0022FE76F4|nr:rab-GTPase-TBC domain-containing protein [Polychytrium aggregatum]KAI9208364.1 rab-GTPase-TBC domain-containing protein [Polychytrium aggregatum]
MSDQPASSPVVAISPPSTPCQQRPSVETKPKDSWDIQPGPNDVARVPELPLESPPRQEPTPEADQVPVDQEADQEAPSTTGASVVLSTTAILGQTDAVDEPNATSKLSQAPEGAPRPAEAEEKSVDADILQQPPVPKSNQNRVPKSRIAKLKRINQAAQTSDIRLLRSLALGPGGFLNDGMRKRCWPMILKQLSGKVERPSSSESSTNPSLDSDSDSDSNLDLDSGPTEAPFEHQVSLDVRRSFTNLIEEQGSSNAAVLKMDQRRSGLTNVISTVLRDHPYLNYYQGFHDVCSTLLLVLGEQAATEAAERIALFWLRDSMETSLDGCMNQLQLVLPLLSLVDKELFEFLNSIEYFLPYFCLSWVLTWCSHDVIGYAKAARLFDAFIVSDPLFPIYISIAVIVNRRAQILELEPDYSIVHSYLTKFPEDIELDDVVEEACKYIELYPPRVLQQRFAINLGKASCVNSFPYDLQRYRQVSSQPPHILIKAHQDFIVQQKEAGKWPPYLMITSATTTLALSAIVVSILAVYLSYGGTHDLFMPF